MNRGYVYILTNDAMPGLVKIGRTSREVNVRAAELWQTGVPERFEVDWAFKTPDCVQLERFVHADLKDRRVSRSREFFRAEQEYAVERVRLWGGIQASEWISQNFDEYAAIHWSEAAATFGVERLVSETGRPGLLISDALAQVTTDELTLAIERVLAERRQEQIEAFRRAGIPEEEWQELLDA